MGKLLKKTLMYGFCSMVLLLSTACQNINRPFVITNPPQMADLYWHGQLTDTKGNRWEVVILPGIRPMLELSKQGWVDAGETIQEYGKESFWSFCGDLAENSLEFAGDSLEFSRDSIVEYLAKGIRDDYSEASENIAENYSRAPFGWIPRIAFNAVWGYFLFPTFRLATAPVGVALGMTGATLGATGFVVLPVGAVLSLPFVAVGYAIIEGVLLPVSGMIAHQFVYLFVLPNREPAEDMDGYFGLYIVNKYRDLENVAVVTPDLESTVTPETTPEEPQEGIAFLHKLVKEYLVIKQALAEYQGKTKDLENFSLYQGNIELAHSFRLTEEAKKYKISELEGYFVQEWRKMKQNLSPQAILTEEEGIAWQNFLDVLSGYDLSIDEF